MTAQSGLGFSGIVAIQIPDDGAAGEVLTKITADNYDYDWVAGGGGGGLVNTVVGGININVDATDPVNPIVNLDAAITGVSVNGVTLSNVGVATDYLDETGNYSDPLGNLIFGADRLVSQVLTLQTTTSAPSVPNNMLIGTFPATHNSLVVPVVPLGDYMLMWVFSWNYNSVSSDFLARINVPSVGFLGFHRQEPKDAAGGANPDAPVGSGTNQRFWVTASQLLVGYTGGETIDLEFAAGNAGISSTIMQSTLYFWRFN